MGRTLTLSKFQQKHFQSAAASAHFQKKEKCKLEKNTNVKYIYSCKLKNNIKLIFSRIVVENLHVTNTDEAETHRAK